MGARNSAPDNDNVLDDNVLEDNVLALPLEMSAEADEVPGTETGEGGVHMVNPTHAGASGIAPEAGRKPLDSSPAKWKPPGTSPTRTTAHHQRRVQAAASPPSMAQDGPRGQGSGPSSHLDPGFMMDTPDGLRMPVSELVVGAALPLDSHGYSGERDELGQRNGDGVQIFPDNRRYSGQFEANRFHGAAIMEWPDGHRYTGQYEDNQKSGDGFFLWPDGRFYDGQWQANQRHGHGQYIAAETYVGDYHEGFRHGDGVLSWPDGKRYAGQFYRGALHGGAVMSWPDGRQYLGQYVDNQKQGEGLFYWPDGRLYEGQWRKGCRHGASRFVDNTGEDSIGQWHKDRLVSSESAATPGVRDPFCEPPATLLTRKKPGKFKPRLEGVAEQPADLGAGAFSPEGKLELASSRSFAKGQRERGKDLSALDVLIQVDDEEPEEPSIVKPDGVVTVNGVDLKFYELYELRNMGNEELRAHANRLHGSFGHVSSPVPQHDNGLLGWVYEIQSRHLRPLLDAAVFEVDDPQYGKEKKERSTTRKGTDHAAELRRPQKSEDLDRLRDAESKDGDDDRYGFEEAAESYPVMRKSLGESYPVDEDNPNIDDDVVVSAPNTYGEPKAPRAAPSNNRRRERPSRLIEESVSKQVK